MAQKIQNVFKRYENKYFVNGKQLETLKNGLSKYMEKDSYGDYTICNIYFDSVDYLLIRSSIEKNQYREKLRLRSYGAAKAGDPVFVEIKKNYDGIVYKRRAKMTSEEASHYLSNGKHPESSNQILNEVDWFMKMYHPIPKVFIAYERSALSGIENSDLRVTFDKNIRWRSTALDLTQGTWGAPLLRTGETLMEIKIPGASPLWLSHLLAQLEIFPISFSKYGTCYKQYLIHDFLKTGVFSCAC